MVLRPPELGVAIVGIGALPSKSAVSLLPLRALALRSRRSYSDSVETSSEQQPPRPGSAGVAMPRWRTFTAEELGLRTTMIPKMTKSVLNELRKRGYDVYLVGGCVRDLVMRRTPKDFDIITTATLKEVKRTFHHCDIVGRRFPICHVHMCGSVVEVSSFKTFGRKSNRSIMYIPRPDGDEHDDLRWNNCLSRDFTINGLMFNPYSDRIYDYLGGIEDIRKAKVRTVITPNISFQEDCARILRAIRIAARLGFSFSRETAVCVKDLGISVLRLDKSRLVMELNYMLAYGSAEASLRLLWKFGLMELLLPIQAAYFVSQGFRRRDKRTNMLLKFFQNLDKLLAPDKPCHNCLWMGILAFHHALVEKPRDPLVVATFALAIHNGGDMAEAVDIARRVSHLHDSRFAELLQPQFWEFDRDLVDGVLDLLYSVKTALSSMTNGHVVSQAMAKYPQAPYSDFVFITLPAYMKVYKIFDCFTTGERERGFVPKKGKINYANLAEGVSSEIRHVFARVVFDTVYPPSTSLKQEEQESSSEDEG